MSVWNVTCAMILSGAARLHPQPLPYSISYSPKFRGRIKVFIHAGRPKYPDATESIGLFNVPYATTQEEIEQLVSQHAGFKKLKMILKPGTTEFRGFCFVDYETVENAIAALEALQGTWIGNKAIDVKFASGPGSNPGWGKGGGKGFDQWGGAGAWGAAPAMWGQQAWGGGW